MHSLLARQIRRWLPSGVCDDALKPILNAVDEAYIAFDADRALAERAMEISSRELNGRNRELTERNSQVHAAHAELQAAHEGLRRLAEELEARVAQRTAELTELNQELINDIAERRTIEEALRVAEMRYRAIFEHATDGIFQTTVDGAYIDCNPALARIYGYSSPEELSAGITDIGPQLYVDPGTRDRFVELMAAHGKVSGFEARIYRKDRKIIWISETARCVRDAEGRLLYFEGFASDITARKQAEELLRESEERYALAVRGAKDGLWDWDLRSGKVYYSARWKEMLGLPEDDVRESAEDWFSRVHPDDVDAVRSAVAAHRDGITPHIEIEHRMRHRDDSYRWMLSRGLAIRDAAGHATRMAGSQTDITIRKQVEEQLLRDALHDGLTGLPNRALFTDRLERSIARCTRDKSHRFAVLFLDVDRFKVLNDSLGHGAGDQLLIAFAKRLCACVRTGDTVARLGGDEFTILLDDPREPDDTVSVADRIQKALRPSFSIDDHEVYVAASIGIAQSDTEYLRPQDVLRDADTAMYSAKAQGRGRYQLFDTAMHTRAVKLLRTENDLRRALERNEFELHYQPILHVGNKTLRGFEALIRWRHPESGLIQPGDFITIAEETGLILPIGRWVLHEACRQTAIWHQMFPDHPVDINVNLSGRQFAQSDLVEQVIAVLQETGLPARHLILEITESVVMENPEATITMLKRLKTLGVQVHIDDFGTGYSSLAYLQRFPIDAMKIDRSFIASMSQNAENAEIVRTIVTLAHNLNMTVTAEGIETADQMARIEHLHCEGAQGYFLSRPLNAEAATNALGKSKDEPAAA